LVPGSAAPLRGIGLVKPWQIAALIGVLAIALLTIAWNLVSAGHSVHYGTAMVTRGSITRTVTATGTVNPELTIIVGTYVSGVIQELYCDYNTVVKKGQLCAKIDARPYQALVDQNKANLAVARAQLEKDKASLAYAKLTLDRKAELLRTSVVSQDTYDNAKSAYDQAQAQVLFDEATIEQRQAELASTQVNLDYTNIVSPVDGTVVSRNVTMGQTVAASFQTPTLFLIATDLTKMEVDTNVSESDIGGLKEGQRASFTVDAYPKRSFEGTVSQIRQSPQTVQNVVTFDIVVTVNNRDLALKPGLTAATRIIVDQQDDVLRVPNTALRYRPSSVVGPDGPEARVWVLRNGQPPPVSIVTGLDDDGFTEIVSGDLQVDEQVITGEQSMTRTTIMPRLR
jgi:HlyD family secretion protein